MLINVKLYMINTASENISQCSVAHPVGAVGWSAVCDCGIS